MSAYALTVEAGTPLAAQPDRHPDDDDLADKYELADDLFAAAGLENYEVSNWARPGHESRHNRLYWLQDDYLGFGSAAHSHRAGRRWWNVRTPERYIAAVEAGEPTEASGETLDADTRRIEGLQLALRMREGIPVEAIDLDGLVGSGGATTTSWWSPTAGPRSPAAADCSPTRSRCACADPAPQQLGPSATRRICSPLGTDVQRRRQAPASWARSASCDQLAPISRTRSAGPGPVSSGRGWCRRCRGCRWC